jgi:hypothetical protein
MSATGFYTNQQLLTNQVGITNLTNWSDVDSTGSINENSLQQAINIGEDKLNNFWYDGPFIVPLTSTQAFGQWLLTKWANDIVLFTLYESRGFFDGQDRNNDKAGNDLKAAYDKAFAEMSMYKGGALTFPGQRRWPTASAPVSVTM